MARDEQREERRQTKSKTGRITVEVKQYEWSSTRRHPAGLDATRTVQELEKIKNKNAGICKPAHVVDAARSPKHYLHPAFEWDDSVAAEEHRKTQARNLINAIQWDISTPEKQIVVPAYISMHDISASDENEGYRPMDAVMANPELRAATLRTAVAELKSLRKRYSMLTELAQVFAAIDGIGN